MQYHLELQSMNCFSELASEETRGQYLLVRSWKIPVICAFFLSTFETMQPVLCVKILKIASWCLRVSEWCKLTLCCHFFFFCFPKRGKMWLLSSIDLGWKSSRGYEIQAHKVGKHSYQFRLQSFRVMHGDVERAGAASSVFLPCVGCRQQTQRCGAYVSFTWEWRLWWEFADTHAFSFVVKVN